MNSRPAFLDKEGSRPFPFGTAGRMTAQELARRLIILIFAGRNRMDMIRRELPRTKRAGWVRKPFRIEAEKLSNISSATGTQGKSGSGSAA